jgi:hypothetical protein
MDSPEIWVDRLPAPHFRLPRLAGRHERPLEMQPRKAFGATASPTNKSANAATCQHQRHGMNESNRIGDRALHSLGADGGQRAARPTLKTKIDSCKKPTHV